MKLGVNFIVFTNVLMYVYQIQGAVLLPKHFIRNLNLLKLETLLNVKRKKKQTNNNLTIFINY